MRKKILLLLPILAICILLSFTISASAAMSQIDLIYTNPAEDCSTSMRFAWHAKTEKCTFKYSYASDYSFSYASTLTVVGELNKITNYTTSLGTFYVFNLQVDNLDPDTNYVYKITSGAYESDIYSFKTAGFNGSFNFVSYSDVHTTGDTEGNSKITNLQNLITKANDATADIGGLDMIISTGDNVKYGDNYAHWQNWNKLDAKKQYMFAIIDGNHEQKTSSRGLTTDKSWFLNTWNNPDNGPDSYTNGSYWFLYNNVLFIAIDNQDNINKTAVGNWADAVLSQNQGKYQYCVVYKHYPCFTTGDSSYCDYGGYPEWRKIWDKYNVDFVISGDSHEYVRTKQLYDDKVSNDDKKGTVYLTATQVPASTSALTILTDPTKIKNVKKVYNSRYAAVGSGAELGAFYFTVTPEKMTMYTYTTGGKVVDSYEVVAKRSLCISEELKKDVVKNLQYLQVKGTNEGVVFDSDSITSVKSISFYNGAELISSFYPSTTQEKTFTLSNLPNDKLLTLTAKITYVDDTNSSVDFVANTFALNKISNFTANIIGDKVTLNWINDTINDSVASIKLYRNNTLLTTLAKTDLSYQFDKTDADVNASYTLALVSSEGDVISSLTCKYFDKGDLNYDGLVNSDDCDLISNYLCGGTLTDVQKSAADINCDGYVNFLDVVYMWMNHKDDSNLHTQYITIIYETLDGTKISTQKILEGGNATEPAAPTIDGYTFVGWTVSSQGLIADTTIYPVYSK